jgi:hypothetical protein
MSRLSRLCSSAYGDAKARLPLLVDEWAHHWHLVVRQVCLDLPPFLSVIELLPQPGRALTWMELLLANLQSFHGS